MSKENLEQIIASNQEKAADFQKMLEHAQRIKGSAASVTINCINKLDMPDMANQVMLKSVILVEELADMLNECIQHNNYLINYANDVLQQTMLKEGQTEQPEPVTQPLPLEQVSVRTFLQAKLRHWFA